MTTSKFIDHKFKAPLPAHDKVEYVKYEDAKEKLDNIDDPKHEWEYFGHGKYGRYAFSKPLGMKRTLSMGEFYGSSTID